MANSMFCNYDTVEPQSFSCKLCREGKDISSGPVLHWGLREDVRHRRYPVNLLQWLQCSADHGSYSSVTSKNDSFVRPCSLRCSSECCCCQLDLLRTHLCKWLKVESTLTDEGIEDWRHSQIQRMSGCPIHNGTLWVGHLWFFHFLLF